MRFIYETPNTAVMSTLPWFLIPGFLVPLYLMTHLIIFTQLRRKVSQADIDAKTELRHMKV